MSGSQRVKPPILPQSPAANCHVCTQLQRRQHATCKARLCCGCCCCCWMLRSMRTPPPPLPPYAAAPPDISLIAIGSSTAAAAEAPPPSSCCLLLGMRQPDRTRALLRPQPAGAVMAASAAVDISVNHCRCNAGSGRRDQQHGALIRPRPAAAMQPRASPVAAPQPKMLSAPTAGRAPVQHCQRRCQRGCQRRCRGTNRRMSQSRSRWGLRPCCHLCTDTADMRCC